MNNVCSFKASVSQYPDIRRHEPVLFYSKNSTEYMLLYYNLVLLIKHREEKENQ